MVLYYAPLFILRGLTGPTRKAAIAKHNTVVDGWKQAVERAEEKMNEENGSTYLPAHVNGMYTVFDDFLSLAFFCCCFCWLHAMA